MGCRLGRLHGASCVPTAQSYASPKMRTQPSNRAAHTDAREAARLVAPSPARAGGCERYTREQT
jgi:hypothetical protein